jgi:hypothetical protein
MNTTITIQSAGQTDAGNAEVQPARDSRTRATNGVGMADFDRPSHLANDHSEPSYALRKPIASYPAEKYSVKAFVHFTLNHYR